MKKDLQFNKWFVLVGTILTLIIGVLILVLAITVTDKLTQAISIIIAIGCFLAGLANVIYGLVKQDDKLISVGVVAGASIISIGVVLCINTLLIKDVIVYFVGVLFLAIGVVKLLQLIVQIIKKSDAKSIVASIAILVVAVTLGTLVIVFNKEDSIKWIYCVIGAVLALCGLIGLIVFLVNNGKKDKKVINAKVEK